MIIRELRKKDLKEISEVASKTYEETFGHSMTPEELKNELMTTRSEKYFLNAMDTDDIFVAVDDKVIGYIQVSDIKVDVEGFEVYESDQAINALYISSKYQGTGLGKMLMDKAFESTRIKNTDRVFVDVWNENERAVRFYNKYGFREVGKCKCLADGEIIGYDLVLMINK